MPGAPLVMAQISNGVLFSLFIRFDVSGLKKRGIERSCQALEIYNIPVPYLIKFFICYKKFQKFVIYGTINCLFCSII